ncbi:prolyl endopeptidase FAP-like isoform X2 [Bombina bombina]|uniref:prolyl endopeptidase FAP-like isoform X2 n=1 Tax=Bombina bombina TaxID=8345 RepID=UPI00235A9A14|nr:prolyl endopeptidase FAP-like isoform X2 [Bombina bombina]
MKAPVKILLASMAIVLLILAIVTTVVLVTSGRNQDVQRPFSFDDVFSSNFYYNQFNLLWISENEYVHKSAERNVIIYNVESGKTTTLVGNTSFDEVNATSYQLSGDRKFLLLESDYKKQWRYSYNASYHIFDVEKGEFLKRNRLPSNIQYISWSPVGHKLVYIMDNNIYLKIEPEDYAIQLTSNGKGNTIFNGIPDWVYEEEMLGSKYATWWSPNAQFIAYVQFNDTEVPTIEYSYYGEDQYPRTINIPYPKAGAKNPTVKVFIAKVDNPSAISTAQVPVPSLISSSEYYFSWVTWVLDERVSVQWVKRIQNVSMISICNFIGGSNTWNCPKNQEHLETSETGWIGVFFPSLPVFSSDSLSFYKIFSDRNGYKHIHYVNDSMENPIQITSGRWEAIYIYIVTDEAIYYSSNEFEGYPGRRNLYKIGLKGSFREKQCITCNIRKERCQYYGARFSYSAKYYSLYCYGPGLPIITLHEGGTNKELQILEGNYKLEANLHTIQMPNEKIGKIVHNGINFWYKMTLPPHFDERKKYPLLLYVYGGPSSQEIHHSFSIGWKTYLASSEDIIVASLDGRGTAYQGDKFMHAVHKRLGTLEIEDQVFAVRKFIEMGFIDEQRIAIWGWSYGGYVTSMALGLGTGLFKCGMAVAPVSNWEYYASIYTERYMGLPTKDDNLENYKNSTVMARAENFKKVDYLLIHGTADDNVHFQQAAQISKALVEAQVDFQAMQMRLCLPYHP